MIQEFKSKRRGYPFQAKRTERGIEIIDMVVRGAEGFYKDFPTIDVTAFDFVEYTVRRKMPLFSGRAAFKTQLNEIEKVCTRLKGDVILYKNQDYRPELILITGDNNDLDIVYQYLEKTMVKKQIKQRI